MDHNRRFAIANLAFTIFIFLAVALSGALLLTVIENNAESEKLRKTVERNSQIDVELTAVKQELNATMKHLTQIKGELAEAKARNKVLQQELEQARGNE
jgi:peptidoglycan hydrolase CwlO-like protein